MEEKIKEIEDTAIDLHKLINVAFENKIKLIVIILICTIIVAIVMMFFPKEYQSTAMIRIKPVSNTLITGSMDISTSNGIDLSNTDIKNITTTECIKLMGSRSFKKLVDEKTGIDNAGSKLSVQDMKNTSLITIIATGSSPEEAHKIAETAVAEWFNFFSALDGNNANEYFQVVDEADIQENPVKPNKKLFILIGAIIGFMIAFSYILFCYSKRYEFK